MLKMSALIKPDTLEAAGALLRKPRHVALAGGTFFQLREQKDLVGVELTHLLGRRIYEENGRIRIEAMASLRDLETDQLFRSGPLSIVSGAVRHLMGPAFRNMATVGGATAARYGASELLTVLLALGAEVELFDLGAVSLQDYLRKPFRNEIISAVTLASGPRQAGYAAACNADTDEPLLCSAVCREDGRWRIAVGARPQTARLYTEEAAAPIEETAARAAAATALGSDLKASAEYRRTICPIIIGRAMEEALRCASN